MSSCVGALQGSKSGSDKKLFHQGNADEARNILNPCRRNDESLGLNCIFTIGPPKGIEVRDRSEGIEVRDFVLKFDFY